MNNGELLYVKARPSFTSSKSMEVEVVVEVENMHGVRVPSAHAYFTFVSLDKAGKTLPIPPLDVCTEEDERRFAAGKERYLQRQAKRQRDALAAAAAAAHVDAE